MSQLDDTVKEGGRKLLRGRSEWKRRGIERVRWKKQKKEDMRGVAEGEEKPERRDGRTQNEGGNKQIYGKMKNHCFSP